MKEIMKSITDNIDNDNTLDAIKIAQEHFPHKSKQLIVLNGSLTRLKKQFNSGALKVDDYNVGMAKISLNLFDLLDQEEEGKTGEPKKSNPIKRLISFQMDFLKDVISDFSRSKIILLATLGFVIIVGITTIVQLSDIMPTTFGKTILIATLIAFFTLIISSLGFLNVQIEQFKGSKSFLKYQEYSGQES